MLKSVSYNTIGSKSIFYCVFYKRYDDNDLNISIENFILLYFIIRFQLRIFLALEPDVHYVNYQLARNDEVALSGFQPVMGVGRRFCWHHQYLLFWARIFTSIQIPLVLWIFISSHLMLRYNDTENSRKHTIAPLSVIMNRQRECLPNLQA